MPRFHTAARALLCLLLLGTSAPSLGALPAVNGWGKLTWGMSPEVAAAMYPGQVQAVPAAGPFDFTSPEGGKYRPLLLVPVQVLGRPFEAHLFFTGRHLTAVVLKPREAFTPGLVNELGRSLEVKYGPPAYPRKDYAAGWYGYLVIWNFQSTKLDLQVQTVQGVPQVWVRYVSLKSFPAGSAPRPNGTADPNL
ncbi:MAG: hypothetical protein FJX76_16725 [Armatimonadetes bacterium]|nr:hypothetical protein [Armatimonadota bacterium]